LNRESGVQKRITVGIPAYNEKQNILNLLQSLEGAAACARLGDLAGDSV
jgi:hypothetical protein